MLELSSLYIPFPLDHFFFCFLPPVAAGALSFSQYTNHQTRPFNGDVPFWGNLFLVERVILIDLNIIHKTIRSVRRRASLR